MLFLRFKLEYFIQSDFIRKHKISRETWKNGRLHIDESIVIQMKKGTQTIKAKLSFSENDSLSIINQTFLDMSEKLNVGI